MKKKGTLRIALKSHWGRPGPPRQEAPRPDPERKRFGGRLEYDPVLDPLRGVTGPPGKSR